eukprot:365431-Chlamydomonas_euryale.AAC.19
MRRAGSGRAGGARAGAGRRRPVDTAAQASWSDRAAPPYILQALPQQLNSPRGALRTSKT